MLPWTCHVVCERLAEILGIPIAISISMHWMAIFILITICLIFYYYIIIRPANREIKRLNSVNEGKLLTNLQEACKGVQTIRAFKKEDYIIQDYK